MIDRNHFDNLARGRNKNSEQLKQTTSLISEMLNWNDSYINTQEEGYFKGFQNSQKPLITLVTCADSRVQQKSFISDPTNRVFTIRNIGNQIFTTFGSIDYGVRLLKTPILMILGHTRCGAIQAAMENYSSETFAIIQELDHLFTPLKGLSPQYLNGDSEEKERLWMAGVERNVDHQVKLVTDHYSDLIEKGSLTVIGAVFDFMNYYESEEGRVVITNLNGTTESDLIRQDPAMQGISKVISDISIRRYTKLH